MPPPADKPAWLDRLAAPYLHPASGVVVGVVTPRDRVFASYGRIDALRPAPPDPDTLFELGSITKVFTALLLAVMVRDGRIDLDQPIGAIRREFASAPVWITPRSLATHTSGLPRIPFTMREVQRIGLANPYAGFDLDDLVAWLARYKPQGPPRADRPSYSNLGMGLLGQLLALVAGQSYESLLRQEILLPLGMTDTGITLGPEQEARLATPHKGGRAVAPWEFDALAGAGAARSSARDLARFAAAVIDATRGTGKLADAISATLEIQVPGAKAKLPAQCFGWTRFPETKLIPPILFHDGGTHGSSSDLRIAPSRGVATIVLANQGLSLWRMIRIAHAKPDRVLAEIAAATGG